MNSTPLLLTISEVTNTGSNGEPQRVPSQVERTPTAAQRIERRRRRQRRRLLPLALLLVIIAGVITWQLDAGTSAKAPHALAASTTTSTSLPPTTTTSTTDPGLLPQTSVEPPIDASLQTALAPLWSAIVTGSPPVAQPVFFPQTAYLQMKMGQIPDPASDYSGRLLAFYDLDIAAYHQALGTGAATAKLLGVDAAATDAAYVPAGTCENGIGYWHLPGVRFVYEEGGNEQSFAVASLISWRGVWYVVHLGPNPRPTNVGTVDQPADGAGTPGPAGGC